MTVIRKHLEVYCNTFEINVNNNGAIVAFNAANVTDSFSFKEKINKIIVPLNY